MEGLHLSQKCFPGKAKYGIRNLVDVLAPELSRLYSAIHGPFLIYASPDGKCLNDEECQKLNEEHDRFLIEERADQDLKLFGCGFLPRFRDYLCGDWTDFYLLASKVSLTTIEPWSNRVPPACQIFITCVDAGYWQVYARDPLLLKRILNQFADAVPCKLGTRRV